MSDTPTDSWFVDDLSAHLLTCQHQLNELRAERDRLREALEKADVALQWVGGTLGATDEWIDHQTMISSVKKTAEDVVFERDRLREALTSVNETIVKLSQNYTAEFDRLREALAAIVENAEMEYFGAYGVEPEFIDAARAALAKEAGK